MFGVVDSLGLMILFNPTVELWLKAVVIICDLTILGLILNLLRIAYEKP